MSLEIKFIAIFIGFVAVFLADMISVIVLIKKGVDFYENPKYFVIIEMLSIIAYMGWMLFWIKA